MIKCFYFLLIFIFWLFPICIKAQQSSDETNLQVINTKNSDIELVKNFIETMGKYHNDPKAPRFLLYDQKNEVAFGIGGFVRFVANYDFNGAILGNDGFIPYLIQVPNNYDYKSLTRFDVTNSKIFFKLIGQNKHFGKYIIYIDGSFTGPSNSYKMSNGYITLGNVTLGRTNSVFINDAASPPTADSQGPNGAASLKTLLIKYSKKLTHNLSFAISAEMPKYSSTTQEGYNEILPQVYPDLPIYLQLNFGKNNNSLIRFATVLRNMTYRNLKTSKNVYQKAYGIQLSTDWRISKTFEYFGSITYGNGVVQYLNDLAGNGLSLVNNPNKAGEMTAPNALGWFSQLQINATNNLFFSIGYSQSRIYHDKNLISPTGVKSVINNTDMFNNDIQYPFSKNSYKYGQYFVMNMFYNPSDDFQIGVEYLHGARKDINNLKGDANRVLVVSVLNF